MSIESINTSLYNPSNAESCFEYGNTLFEEERLEEAEFCFQQAVRINSTMTAAWYNLGNCQMRNHSFDDAVISFETAICLEPDLFEAHFNLGICFEASGKIDDAVKRFRRTVKLKPDFLPAREMLASLLNRGPLSSSHFEMLKEGDRQFNESNYPLAIESYCALLAQRPDCASAQNSLGVALERLGKYEAARDCYAYAVEIDPINLDYILNLGAAYQHLGEVDIALQCYKYGALAAPDSADCANNIGAALQFLDQVEEAEIYHRQALAVNPCHVGALTNLGNVLMQQLKMDEAAECYKKALVILPHYSPTHMHLGMALLIKGDYAEGWKEYDYRVTERPDLCGPEHPKWNGSSMSGKTLLIYTEGGFGDTIMLARYLPLVKQQADCRVLFECRPELHSLLKRSEIANCFDIKKPEDTHYDAQISLFSLPALFGTLLETIPGFDSYITSNPADVKGWHTKLGSAKIFRVGIRWSGNPNHRNDRNRSCSPEVFLKLSEIPNVQLFSLQAGPISESHLSLMETHHIIDLNRDLTSFDQTAAALSCMDLIITVDTSIAHLSGAMGLPTWTILPYFPDWRWLLSRSDSPWYPTMKLFRQEKPGDWNSVAQQLFNELAKMQLLAA